MATHNLTMKRLSTVHRLFSFGVPVVLQYWVKRTRRLNYVKCAHNEIHWIVTHKRFVFFFLAGHHCVGIQKAYSLTCGIPFVSGWKKTIGIADEKSAVTQAVVELHFSPFFSRLWIIYFATLIFYSHWVMLRFSKSSLKWDVSGFASLGMKLKSYMTKNSNQSHWYSAHCYTATDCCFKVTWIPYNSFCVNAREFSAVYFDRFFFSKFT